MRSDFSLLVPILLVQAASLRSLDKYVFHDRSLAVAAGAALSVAIFLLARNATRLIGALPASVARLARSHVPLLILGILLTITVVVVYPRADGLKASGGGSDADDAMILGAVNLFAHLDPYRETTYLGNSLSPGPGWILLVSPFSATGLYAWFIPASMGLFYLMLASVAARREALIEAAIVLLTGLGVWEVMVVGIDLLPLGIALAGLTWLIARAPQGAAGRVGLAALCGLVLTGRVILPVLLPAAALHLVRARGARAAGAFCGISLAVCLSIHGMFWLRAERYMPAHVLAKGVNLLAALQLTNVWLLTLLALLSAWPAYRLARWLATGREEDLVLGSALSLTGPMVVIAAADLVSKRGSLTEWEINYIVVTIPLWIYYYVLRGASPRADFDEPCSGSEGT